MPQSVRRVLGLFAILLCACGASETPQKVAERHALVASRRAGVAVICHRGASEFAHENTLDAYNATLDLGGDGNEIDIRQTRDGVLVIFHDDLLDLLLEDACGDVSDLTWPELQKLRFRDPGPTGATAKIPTFEEVLQLHRDRGALLVLDVKRPGLDEAIAKLLDQYDMWDHVIGVNTETAPKLAKNPRVKPRPFKAGLFQNRSEVFADQIEAALKLPGNDLICDDPRGAIVALGRKLGKVAPKSQAPPRAKTDSRPSTAELLRVVRDAPDWDQVADGEAEQKKSAERICVRAKAADQLMESGETSSGIFAGLADRARHRSLHKQWLYHGLDGANALRALIVLRAPEAPKVAREIIFGVDPALKSVRDPQWNNPLGWTDWRIKQIAFPSLAQWRDNAEAEKLCRDYLAFTDAAARELGIPLFEPAAKALLEIMHDEKTAIELMHHRLQEVRARTILVSLAHADESWAMDALKAGAPHALAYVVKR